MATQRAPKVKKLSQIMQALEPGYGEQRGLYKEQLSALPGQFQAAKQRLEGTKQQEFRDINTGAARKGMSFSGIPMHEQSQYLANEYLPGLTGLEEAQGSARTQLQMALAQLNQSQRSEAMGVQEQQRTRRQTVLDAIRNRQHQLRMQREQLAQQARLQREQLAARAREAAADRAARASSQPTPTDELAEDRRATAQFLGARVGEDGKVSPETYRQARNSWIASGRSPQKFDKFYKPFVNMGHAQDYSPRWSGRNQRLANRPTF